MKIMKTEKVEFEHEVVDQMFCDICKEEIKSNDVYSVEEVIVELHSGSQFPEGGYIDRTEYDICIDCFVNKIQPFLKSLGAEPREYTIDL